MLFSDPCLSDCTVHTAHYYSLTLPTRLHTSQLLFPTYSTTAFLAFSFPLPPSLLTYLHISLPPFLISLSSFLFYFYFVTLSRLSRTRPRSRPRLPILCPPSISQTSSSLLILRLERCFLRCLLLYLRAQYVDVLRACARERAVMGVVWIHVLC
ncbi:hypothetical protein DM02DRAFT_212836 [Periconia macrospinosa]|uniref:Uncharacterized protein n=1 Tax=Periconia macrospinosa TaxID=97972 RepID=A0A2V1E0C3_9PLEO|nr:hypothetical protein DM02DRAFT_212836 [Periconia macrospinosa]